MSASALGSYSGPSLPQAALPPPGAAASGNNAAGMKMKAGDPASVKKTAQDFESFFLTQSFETMFEGIGKDTLLGGGNGEQVFHSLLVQEYGKIASQTGSLGLADTIQREMMHLQEVR